MNNIIQLKLNKPQELMFVGQTSKIQNRYILPFKFYTVTLNYVKPDKSFTVSIERDGWKVYCPYDSNEAFRQNWRYLSPIAKNRFINSFPNLDDNYKEYNEGSLSSYGFYSYDSLDCQMIVLDARDSIAINHDIFCDVCFTEFCPWKEYPWDVGVRALFIRKDEQYSKSIDHVSIEGRDWKDLKDKLRSKEDLEKMLLNKFTSMD